MSRISPHRIGETIAGRYRLISQLGEGGFGVAYRAWDQDSGVPIVLKMPLAKHLVRPVVVERFEREVVRLRQCTHPHIVPIMDDGRDDLGRPFLVMRFLPGGSLADRKKPVGATALHRWLPAVASALDYIHGEGVLHRDVKPANIFFDTQARAFLGDFGIAKLVDERVDDGIDDAAPFSESHHAWHEPEESLTRTGSLIGTYAYMAPELFAERPRLTPQADQYSLAVAVYEMLCGKLPVVGTEEILRRFHRTEKPVPLSNRVKAVPTSLSVAVDKALAKRPDERFLTCQEFAAAVLAEVPFTPIDPSHYRFLCPACQRLVRVPQDFGGRSCRCPDCNVVLRVSQSLDALWRAEEAPRNTPPGRTLRLATANAKPLLEFACIVQVSAKRATFSVLKDRGTRYIVIGGLAVAIAGKTGHEYHVAATNQGIEFTCRADNKGRVPTAKESAKYDFKLAWSEIAGVHKPATIGTGEVRFDRKDGVRTRCRFCETGKEDTVFQELRKTFEGLTGLAFVYERTPLWKMLVVPVAWMAQTVAYAFGFVFLLFDEGPIVRLGCIFAFVVLGAIGIHGGIHGAVNAWRRHNTLVAPEGKDGHV